MYNIHQKADKNHNDFSEKYNDPPKNDLIYYYICGILRPEIEYMRYYKSADFFIDQEFPLSVSKTRQRDFMVEHGHDFIEIVLVSSGKSLHRISGDSGNASYGLIRGEDFTVMPGEIHSYCDSKNFEIYNIAFLPQVIAGEIDENRVLNYEFIKLDDTEFAIYEQNVDNIFANEELVECLNELKLDENKFFEIYLVGSRNFEINTNQILGFVINLNI